jgi:uncharacterized protein DUF1801
MASSQKTVPTGASAEAFLAAVTGETRRADAQRLAALLAEWTGEPPVMWGASIVGFGRYEYRYDSGHGGTAPLVGFSPRKPHLVVYLVAGYQERDPELLEQLGPHGVGKGCLYLKRLGDVDHGTLRALVDRTVRAHRAADRRASA